MSGDLVSTVRPADAIDVVVVAVLIYFVIVWFRRARSRFVIGGFAALGVVYVVARLLDMYLTLLIFQALVTVALVAVVVIFQEDIRRGFERIAIRGSLSFEDKGRAGARYIDVVVDAISQLANRRIGALVVFRGKEPLERHVTGGVPLDGRISEPLLCSIFDPHSPGHDGAAIIDRGLIRFFGVHLPLSTRAPAHVGTRHAAALGLSERSDALVVAVSEERGTISLATGGELSVVGPAELKSALEKFLRGISPEQPVPLWRRLLVENLGTKLLSLALAVTAWLLLFGPQSETVARTFDVPVAYRDVPDAFIVDEPQPREVRITLSGPSRAFDMLDPGELGVSLNVADLRAGTQRIEVAEPEIEHPRELSVSRVEPRSVTVVAQPTRERELAVKPALLGSLPPRLRLVAVRTDPESVPAAVQQSELGKVTHLLTEPVDLSRIEETTTLTRALRLPRGVRLAKTAPREVSVSVEVALR